MNPYLAKEAAALLQTVKEENTKLAEDNAAKAKEIAVLKRRDDSLKLAAVVCERDGVTDYQTYLAKAAEIENSPRSMELMTTAVEMGGTRDFTMGKAASGHRPEGGASPEDVFIDFLSSPD